MSLHLSLEDWKEFVEQVSSGDQIHCVVDDWEYHNVMVKNATLDLIHYIGEHEPNLRAHTFLQVLVDKLLDRVE